MPNQLTCLDIANYSLSLLLKGLLSCMLVHYAIKIIGLYSFLNLVLVASLHCNHEYVKEYIVLVEK